MSFTRQRQNIGAIFNSKLDSLQQLAFYHFSVYSQYQEEQLFLNCMKKGSLLLKPSGERCTQKSRKQFEERYGKKIRQEKNYLEEKFGKARSCIKEEAKIPEPVYSQCMRDILKETQRIYQNNLSMANGLLTSIGFMISFSLFKQYSSDAPGLRQRKKYVSYSVLKDSVIPAMKTMDSEFMKRAWKQYIEQINRQIFRPF